MTILIWIVRVLVIAFLLRLILRALVGTGAPARPAPRQRSRPPAERLGGALVRDPQCGTYVPETRALTVGRGPTALHFCSTACRDAWMRAHAR